MPQLGSRDYATADTSWCPPSVWNKSLILAIAICLSSAACGSTGAHGTDLLPAPTTSIAVDPIIAADRTGSRIAATASGALVIDADSGVLFSIDSTGKVLAKRGIGRGAGLLVYDPEHGRAYVADRSGDRLVVLDTRSGLAVLDEWHTPAEPFGVALTPDGQTLLVTTIADRTLVAFDVEDGTERWRTALSAGARGVTVAPGANRALVSSTATGTLDLVELQGAHRVASIPFDLSCVLCQQVGAFARGTGFVRFIDEERAIATFQRSIPTALTKTMSGLYSGGARPPITQHVAFFTFSKDQEEHSVDQRVAQIVEHQPRGLLWDSEDDTLYVTGHGSDTLLKLPQISSSGPSAVESSASDFVLRTSDHCGADGLALDRTGDLLIWCSFSRTVLRLGQDMLLKETAPLVASSYTPAQHLGLVLFNSNRTEINRDRALACSSCHPEGGADGLSWEIGEHALQTPALAGRVTGTAPYKWDGSDADLYQSVGRTITRLGGAGVSATQLAGLVAYLEWLPAPRAPTLDPLQVQRGRAVFEGVGGCDSCHEGTTLCDDGLYKFDSSLLHANTPSLVGLNTSAPYYHDGSAKTLDDLLNGRGAVHGMAKPSSLRDVQRADLRTYLKSL
jgi:hypothetical protein